MLYIITYTCLLLQKIGSYHDLKDEIASLRITVPLSMFCLDCTALNDDLCVRAQEQKERLIKFEVDDNRDLNRGYICEMMCHLKYNLLRFFVYISKFISQFHNLFEDIFTNVFCT